ncbi:MAG: alpha/beta hydrolase-fold protein [Reichenbachiella sp.]|uniref:alpha/beta hydrolase-fold protein n=1 Tax=Reichenbachiella sp. TaxID=2184521 RepID=UPI003266EFBE
MKSATLIVLFTTLLTQITNAQLSGSDIVIGQTHVISSEILNEDREIQIYLPVGYDTLLQKTYPVLYVMDGQEYFMQGIAYQNMLRFRDKTPAFIVVGIKTDRRRRRELMYNESDAFIDFIKRELIPFVDNNFRTKKEKERIYFGWEMGGGLGLELVGEHAGLFSGFILASTTHSGRRMDAIYERDIDNSTAEYMLFVVAPEETWAASDSLFISRFRNENNPNSRWRYGILDREDHYTTANKAIHEGLSDYFHDYKPIRYYSLQEYDDYGGLKALRSYYEKRGIRYDLPSEIHKETRHFLLLNALNENNYTRFENYVNEFDGYLASYTRPLWFNRFGRFYLANDKIDQSIELFKTGLSKFPEASLLHHGLGDVYHALGKRKLAKQSYQKAIEIAIENDESELVEYQSSLKNL